MYIHLSTKSFFDFSTFSAKNIRGKSGRVLLEAKCFLSNVKAMNETLNALRKSPVNHSGPTHLLTTKPFNACTLARNANRK